ncbi:integrase, catalytic region, zinc finger, CCHC-type containing protein [Tanacetum coccineum]
MELYMMNRQHGQMILESVENGPLIWPSIEENGVTRPKKYSELSATEAIQADYDIKATNIILQGLPREVYALSQQYSINQSSTPLSITHPSNDYHSSVHHNAYSPSSSIPKLECAPTINQQQQQPEFSQSDLGITVLVFQRGDDPIDAINHGRQFSFALGTSKTYNRGASRSNSGKQRTVICYNCKGEGHMSKQCTKPKRKRDDSWFKEKVLLVQAQAHSQILNEEELAFLADPDIHEVALMANLSHYGSDALAKVHNHDNVNNNMLNQAVQAMPSSEQLNVMKPLEIEITSFQNPFYLKKAQQLEPKLYDGNVIEKTNAIVIPDSEETLMLAEESHLKMILKQKDPIIPIKVDVPKEIPKVSMVNMSLKKLKHHLACFDVVVKERTMATAITKGS